MSFLKSTSQRPYWPTGRIVAPPSHRAAAPASSLRLISFSSASFDTSPISRPTLANLAPVGAERGAPALGIRLDHCSFRLVACILVDGRKELLERVFTAGVLVIASASCLGVLGDSIVVHALHWGLTTYRISRLFLLFHIKLVPVSSLHLRLLLWRRIRQRDSSCRRAGGDGGSGREQ